MHAVFGLFTRRPVITMLVAVALGVAAGWHANRLLAVHEPPSVATEPVLSILMEPGERLAWAHTSDFQVRESFARCRNPVHVEVEALVDGAQFPSDSQLAKRGYVHGVLIDPLAQSSSLRLSEHATDTVPEQWTTPKHSVVRREHHEISFEAPLQLWSPSSVIVGMATADSVRWVLVKVRFTANWVLPRSSGTCFVRFPTVETPKIDPVKPPNEAVYAPRPGPAKVDVISSSGEVVDAQSSIPPPTDPRIPEWTCASTATLSVAQEDSPTSGVANCGGVAIFAEPGADKHVSFWLLIDGALIGVAAALFVESAVKFPWRPTAEQSD